MPGPDTRRRRRTHPRARQHTQRALQRTLDTLADDLVDDLISVLNGTLAGPRPAPRTPRDRHRRHRSTPTGSPWEITDPYDRAADAPYPTVDTGMRERAAARGGTFTRTPQHPAGTALCWTVPNLR